MCTNIHKSDVKRRNTWLGFLDWYMRKVLRMRNCWSHETVLVYKYLPRLETLKQSGLWSSLGAHGSLVVIYFQLWWSQKIWHFESNLTLKVKVNCPTKQSPVNDQKPQIWPVSLSQSEAERRKINRPWPKPNQFWRWSGYISMQNFRPFQGSWGPRGKGPGPLKIQCFDLYLKDFFNNQHKICMFSIVKSFPHSLRAGSPSGWLLTTRVMLDSLKE